MSLMERLDDEILEGLKEEQELYNEMERSSDIRLNIPETIFQIDSKVKVISISEGHFSSNSENFNVNSNVNGFLENSFEARNNPNGILPNLSGIQSNFKAFLIHFEKPYMKTALSKTLQNSII